MGADGSQALPVLIEMLKDVDPVARQSAARTLGLFGGSAKEAVPDLIAMVDDPDHGVKTEVILALGNIGDPQAVPVLMEVLKEQLGSGTEPQTYYTGAGTTIQALSAMKEAAAPALPLFIEAVKSEDYSTASSALDALEVIGPTAREAVPTLIEIMEMGDQATLSEWLVADTLEVITGQDFGEDAAAWRAWWEANK
jgi:HEAT repeat protein